MFFGGMFIDHRVQDAVLRCIAERGINSADIDGVAGLLGRSRSTLYRQYSNWRALLDYTHNRTLEAIDRLFACRSEKRRVELDAWWEGVLNFLRAPHGRAFRSLRTRIDTDALEHDEICRLPMLVAWIERAVAPPRPGTPALARATWLLVLSAAACEPGSSTEVDLRELVWLMTGNIDVSADGELELDADHAVAQPKS